MAVTTLLLTPKSEATWKVAGATMDEETGVMKVKEETTKVAAHLRRNGQLHRDKQFGVLSALCQASENKMSHELTFSGYLDLGDRPNR